MLAAYALLSLLTLDLEYSPIASSLPHFALESNIQSHHGSRLHFPLRGIRFDLDSRFPAGLQWFAKTGLLANSIRATLSTANILSQSTSYN